MNEVSMIRRTMTTQQKQKIISSIRDEIFKYEEVVFTYLHGSFPGEGAFADVDLALFLDSAKVSKEETLSYKKNTGLKT
jgi:hypothetical protein